MFKVIERTDKDQDHLLVEGDNIVMDTEDNGTEFTGDRNGVSCVIGLFLLVLTLVDEVPVDNLWFDLGAQLDEESTVAELLVVEFLDLLGLTDPGEEIVFGLGSDDLEGVQSYELPNDGENELSVSIVDI